MCSSHHACQGMWRSSICFCATSCKIAFILVQVLFPSGNCKSRQPFLFHSLLLMDFSGVALLLIGTAVVAIILGHEMACLASDADIDEILASKRPYLTCVLYFICTLINCALKSVWYICKVPWLITRVMAAPGTCRDAPFVACVMAAPGTCRDAHLHGQTRPMLNVEIL